MSNAVCFQYQNGKIRLKPDMTDPFKIGYCFNNDVTKATFENIKVVVWLGDAIIAEDLINYKFTHPGKYYVEVKDKTTKLLSKGTFYIGVEGGGPVYGFDDYKTKIELPKLIKKVVCYMGRIEGNSTHSEYVDFPEGFTIANSVVVGTKIRWALTGNPSTVLDPDVEYQVHVIDNTNNTVNLSPSISANVDSQSGKERLRIEVTGTGGNYHFMVYIYLMRVE